MRDQVGRKALSRNRVDSETHAVDGDRALSRNEMRELIREIDLQERVGCGGRPSEARDRADAVDVPGDEMASQTLAQAQGLFQIHAAHAVEPAGAGKRFRGNIEAHRRAGDVDHGQAATVDRDAIAKLQAACDCGVVDSKAASIRLDHLGDGANDPGEHRRKR